MRDQPVPFVDLGRIHAPLRPELERALEEVMRSGDFILGERVARFEQKFARYVGAATGVGVHSGTAAISIALAAAGIGRGDEVVVPADTYIGSALGVVHAGATPVFCDVDENTGLIDLGSAAQVVGESTAAILPVHLFGQVCAMDAIARFAGARGLAVIEDAAQAHGATWRGRKAGSFGLAAAFSFYPSKNLGALGDGGMICTSDLALADRARRLRNVGQLHKGDHAVAGFNERLDTIQAAVLEVKLSHLDEWNRSRAEAAATYRERLPDGARPLPQGTDSGDAHHLFPIRLADRELVARALRRRAIGTGVHYAPAVHRQPPFRDSPCRTALSHAEAWAAQELSLPMFAGITDAEVRRTCEALEESLAGARTAVAKGSAA